MGGEMWIMKNIREIVFREEWCHSLKKKTGMPYTILVLIMRFVVAESRRRT